MLANVYEGYKIDFTVLSFSSGLCGGLPLFVGYRMSSEFCGLQSTTFTWFRPTLRGCCCALPCISSTLRYGGTLRMSCLAGCWALSLAGITQQVWNQFDEIIAIRIISFRLPCGRIRRATGLYSQRELAVYAEPPVHRRRPAVSFEHIWYFIIKMWTVIGFRCMTLFTARPNFADRVMWIMDKVFKYSNFGCVSWMHDDFFILAVSSSIFWKVHYKLTSFLTSKGKRKPRSLNRGSQKPPAQSFPQEEAEIHCALSRGRLLAEAEAY